MAALSREEAEAVREALSLQRKGQPYEQVLGKAMRRIGLDFDAYVRVMGEIRVVARKSKISVERAAKEMLASSEHKKKDDRDK